jgi:DNA repair photolyase
MGRRATFVPYRPKTILNKHKRADHWFWTRYSAYPYIGCQHGCEFCYCREEKYYPYEDVNDFAYVIKVKENAPDLLRRALSRAPVDLVFTGDYQPVERKFQLSRQMLEVCYSLGFPVFVLERSPLVLRDLDLLRAIKARSTAVVAFSILSTPDSPGYERVRQMERLAPRLEKRFAAMEEIAKAGILTGTCMMPVLPGVSDDDATLDDVVRWTAGHGGKFILAGGLTLADQQRDYFLGVLRERFPDLLGFYQTQYPEGSYGPEHGRWRKVALKIKDLCEKRIVEVLAKQLYYMELNNEASQRLWAYRKAAWAIEDLEQDVGLVYRQMGVKGLTSIENVGPRMAREVERILLEVDAPGDTIPPSVEADHTTAGASEPTLGGQLELPL